MWKFTLICRKCVFFKDCQLIFTHDLNLLNITSDFISLYVTSYLTFLPCIRLSCFFRSDFILLHFAFDFTLLQYRPNITLLYIWLDFMLLSYLYIRLYLTLTLYSISLQIWLYFTFNLNLLSFRSVSSLLYLIF